MPEAGAMWSGRGIVKGQASGPAMVSASALSFLGDVDIRSGQVVGRANDLLGRTVTGAVLVLPDAEVARRARQDAVLRQDRR